MSNSQELCVEGKARGRREGGDQDLDLQSLMRTGKGEGTIIHTRINHGYNHITDIQYHIHILTIAKILTYNPTIILQSQHQDLTSTIQEYGRGEDSSKERRIPTIHTNTDPQ